MGCGFKSEHAVTRGRVVEDFFLWIFHVPLSAAIDGFVVDYELNLILQLISDFVAFCANSIKQMMLSK